MRIGLVTPQVFSVKCQMESYGAEFTLALLADALARRGHDVTMYAPQGSECGKATVFETIPAKAQWGDEEEAAFLLYQNHAAKQDILIDATHQYHPYRLGRPTVHAMFGIQTKVPVPD